MEARYVEQFLFQGVLLCIVTKLIPWSPSPCPPPPTQQGWRYLPKPVVRALVWDLLKLGTKPLLQLTETVDDIYSTVRGQALDSFSWVYLDFGKPVFQLKSISLQTVSQLWALKNNHLCMGCSVFAHIQKTKQSYLAFLVQILKC